MYTDQCTIISEINKAFRRHQLPSEIQFNQGGVCNGLAVVYAKYVLEGNDKRFMELLEAVGTGRFLEKTFPSKMNLSYTS